MARNVIRCDARHPLLGCLCSLPTGHDGQHTSLADCVWTDRDTDKLVAAVLSPAANQALARLLLSLTKLVDVATAQLEDQIQKGK